MRRMFSENQIKSVVNQAMSNGELIGKFGNKRYLYCIYGLSFVDEDEKEYRCQSLSVISSHRYGVHPDASSDFGLIIFNSFNLLYPLIYNADDQSVAPLSLESNEAGDINLNDNEVTLDTLQFVMIDLVTGECVTYEY